MVLGVAEVVGEDVTHMNTAIHKISWISAIGLLVAVNTFGLWQWKLGGFALLAMLALLFWFLFLLVLLIMHAAMIIRERAINWSTGLSMTLLGLSVGLTCAFPRGIVDLSGSGANDLLIAYREGAANCSITLTLK